MSSNLKPRVIAGAVAGLAVVGGGGAYAATQLGSPQQENQAVLNDAASQLGVEPSALSAALKKALENRVDDAVSAGRLTKAQGDELKQRIESGEVPLFGGPGFGFHHEGRMFGGLDSAATYLGITQAAPIFRERHDSCDRKAPLTGRRFDCRPGLDISAESALF